ncbi:MAG: ADP-ribosylglycohydrolase family protein [Bacteroidales bacterium]
MTSLPRLDRYRGCLLGLGVGDALGTALEFESPGSFDPISDVVGGGPFNLEAGQWTDDTSMALCLAESLIERRGFDPIDQLERYVRWWRGGYMSCTGVCFDIGRTVSSALARFEDAREPYPGDTGDMSAGNGSIMRLAPVAMFYAARPQKAIDYAAASSRTTHRAHEAVDGCRYMAGLLVGLLNGLPKEEVLRSDYEAVPGLWDTQPLARKIAKIRQGSFKTRNPPQIRGSGYVVASLEAALWAFWRSTSFDEGALLAVNLGDDADTTGAVYGQLAGAAYGMSGIPENWLAKLAWRDRIASMADAILEVASAGS